MVSVAAHIFAYKGVRVQTLLDCDAFAVVVPHTLLHLEVTCMQLQARGAVWRQDGWISWLFTLDWWV